MAITNQYDDIIKSAADKYELNPALIKAVMEQESAGKWWVTSDAGAMGLMQLMPGTAKSLGVSKPFNPEQNIMGGAKYLRQMHDKYDGDTTLALMAYAAGEGNVNNYLKGKPSAVGPVTKGYPAKTWKNFQKYAGQFERQVPEEISPPITPSQATESYGGTTPNAISAAQQAEIDLPEIPGFEFPKTTAKAEEPIDLPEIPGFEFPKEAASTSSNAEVQLEPYSTKSTSDVPVNPNLVWALAHPEQAKLIENMGAGERALVGAGYGFEDLLRGFKQTGAQIKEQTGFPQSVSDDPTRLQRITQEGMQAREEMEPLLRSSPAAQIGEMIGRTAPLMNIPGGREGGAALRALTSALGGAGMGATSFMEPGQSRVNNALLGGALGGATSVGMSGLGKLANMASEPAVSPEQTIRRQLSKQWDVPITLNEENAGMSSRKDVLLERMPGFLGNKNFRINQLLKSQEAAKRFFSEYVVDPTLGTTAAMKEVNDAYLNTLYNKVRLTGAKVPSAPADNVEVAADTLLNRYPSVFHSIQDNKVKKILTDISNDVSDKTVNTGVLSPSGQPIIRSVTPQFSFFDLWELRKGIGQEMRDATTDTARGQFKTIYAAVSDDIDNMLAKSSGKALNDFRAANEAFKQYSVKFDVLREAYDKAIGTTKSGEFFSPKKFSTDLKNLANDPNYKKNVNWTQDEVNEMTGLANILQVAKRSGQFVENPPTGQRYGAITAGLEGLSYMAGGTAGAIKTAGGLGAVAGMSLAAKLLTTTEAGKRLALAASKVEPGTPAMNKIMNQLYQQLPKFAVEYGLMETQKAGSKVGSGTPLTPRLISQISERVQSVGSQ